MRACEPDVVVLQEATDPAVVRRMAEVAGMSTWAADARHSVGFMSRIPVESHAWHRPAASRRAFLEIVPRDLPARVFGLHLSAIHSNVTELRRVRELQALLSAIERHRGGLHVLAGDFNTLAPGEALDVRRLPYRLQAVLWLTGRRIRWQTIQVMLDAHYVDAWRVLHPGQPGFTFPTWDPHVRLDYVFVPHSATGRVRSCEVVTGVRDVRHASDHFPVLAEIEVG